MHVGVLSAFTVSGRVLRAHGLKACLDRLRIDRCDCHFGRHFNDAQCGAAPWRLKRDGTRRWISKEAWDAWLKHQTMLINENRLNMADARARKYLATQMERHFFGEGADAAQGYVPPTA